jgi:hypothetical protein
MNGSLTAEEGMRLATELYGAGRPVVVFTQGQSVLLHGAETLQAIIGTECPRETSVVELPISLEDWERSDWPEIFEAARQLYLKDELPESN